MKKSKETYVFNGSSDNSRKQELTTDGDKLFINYSFNLSSSQGTNWANNLKHETEHAMQFEHGEIGFELYDKGCSVGGDGVYYPNNEWKAVNFDLNDEYSARMKGYLGTQLKSNQGTARDLWLENDNSIEGKERNYDALRSRGYIGGMPRDNPNSEKIKTSTHYLLPYRQRN